MNVNKKIENFIKKFVQIIAIILLVFLFITSIFGTAHVDSEEITTYLKDNPIVHIISICVILGIIYFVRKKEIKISKKSLYIIIGVWISIMFVWIMITQLYPRADQKYILNSATELLSGKTSSFKAGKYAGDNPHQIGLIFFEFLTGLIFRKYNFIGLQLLNILALLVTVFAIYKITRIMFKNRETSIGTIFALILFAPLSFYVTFIYGNLYGLALSTVAIWFLLKYLEGKKVKDILISAVCMELAILLKSNYLIIMLSMICLLILYIIKEKRLKTFIPIFILILAYIIGNFGINITTRLVTGKEKNEGIPMKAYVAMGFQEGKRAPGWYNRYNRKVYKDSKYNTEKAEKKIDKNIKKSLNKFKQYPDYTRQFFYYKTVSQWNNPTFQSLWINKMRKSNIEKNALVKSIIGEGKVNKILTYYMNIIQSLVLFGAAAYMILDFKNIKSKQLIFIIAFIGGFLFHIIWEAKCQYTMIYFVLLIPYSVRGFSILCNKVHK